MLLYTRAKNCPMCSASNCVWGDTGRFLVEKWCTIECLLQQNILTAGLGKTGDADEWDAREFRCAASVSSSVASFFLDPPRNLSRLSSEHWSGYIQPSSLFLNRCFPLEILFFLLFMCVLLSVCICMCVSACAHGRGILRLGRNPP